MDTSTHVRSKRRYRSTEEKRQILAEATTPESQAIGHEGGEQDECLDRTSSEQSHPLAQGGHQTRFPSSASTGKVTCLSTSGPVAWRRRSRHCRSHRSGLQAIDHGDQDVWYSGPTVFLLTLGLHHPMKQRLG
jgi:hypothetical protein